MSAGGAATAEAIAVAQIRAAAAIAAEGSLTRDPGLRVRFVAVADACFHLSRGTGADIRSFGVRGMIVLREACSDLRESCAAACAGIPDGRLEGAVRLHQAVDAAATALGAAPSCFQDEDQWDVGGADERIDLTGLAPTAFTAAMVCLDPDELLRKVPGAALMRRDAFRLAAGALVLRAGCLSPDGVPSAAASGLAEETRDCAGRISDAAAGWHGVDPDGRLGRLREALEAASALARDLVAELGSPAHGGPGGP